MLRTLLYATEAPEYPEVHVCPSVNLIYEPNSVLKYMTEPTKAFLQPRQNKSPHSFSVLPI